MNPLPFRPGLDPRPVTISQVAGNQWHAVQNDLTVGRGYAARRLDGRTFLSIDTWQDAVFDRLAAVMLANQPDPQYTVVDETDHELTAGWERAGLTIWRRESEFVVPTGHDPAKLPAGITITTANEAPLRALDQAIRAEVEATVGWHTMPAEVLPWQGGTRPLDPSKCTVAIRDGRYVGMVRVATRTRRPRIGLVAVLTEERRQGIARALLSQVLNELHRAGTEAVTAEVDETNTAATALLEQLGAQRTGRTLELVSRPERG
ncbi:GNAT family N-acetyltransferase [Kribbella sp. NPDC048928]|uniref:GNAT family N-acetyltransferase n=1 Tax=Kribbella sp. NPDC048928 TaxID=3364111 RepID=UPI0037181FC0